MTASRTARRWVGRPASAPTFDLGLIGIGACPSPHSVGPTAQPVASMAATRQAEIVNRSSCIGGMARLSFCCSPLYL